MAAVAFFNEQTPGFIMTSPFQTGSLSSATTSCATSTRRGTSFGAFLVEDGGEGKREEGFFWSFLSESQTAQREGEEGKASLAQKKTTYTVAVSPVCFNYIKRESEGRR